jgi:Tfp pilus assembly protein PilO
MNIGWKQRYTSSKNLITRTIQTYNQKSDLKAYLELFLSLAAIIIFGLFAIRPTLINIGKLLTEIKAKEDVVNTMSEKIENLKTAQQIYNQNKGKVDTAKSAILDEPSPQTLIRQVEAASMDSSVFLTNLSISGVDLLGVTNAQVTPQTAQSLTDENILTFSLTVTGDFNPLLSFLKEVENLRRPIKLNEVTLGKVISSQGESVLQLSLTKLGLPYLKDD